MIRRRKEKFRPILPKKAQQSSSHAQSQKKEQGVTDEKATEAHSVTNDKTDNPQELTPQETVDTDLRNLNSATDDHQDMLLNSSLQKCVELDSAPPNADVMSYFSGTAEDVDSAGSVVKNLENTACNQLQNHASSEAVSVEASINEFTGSVGQPSSGALLKNQMTSNNSHSQEIAVISEQNTNTPKDEKKAEAVVVAATRNSKNNPPKVRRRKLVAVPNTKRATRPNAAGEKVTPTKVLSDDHEKSSCQQLQLVGSGFDGKSDTSHGERRKGSSSEQVAASNALIADPAVPALEKFDHCEKNQEEVLISSPSSSSTGGSTLIAALPSDVLPALNASDADTVHIKHSTKLSPNVAQADSVHESASKEKQSKDNVNKRRAMEKLKQLQERNPECENKAWPTLDPNLFSMSDLIYLNPPRSTGKELGIRARMREVEELAAQNTEVHSPAPAPTNSSEQREDDNDTQSVTDEPALVPQLRVNEDGTVVLDEESLVISSNPKTVETVDSSPAVYETGLTTKINQYSFRKRPPSRASRWTNRQTDKFFMALSIVGADFDLMSAMFRNRTRDELRRKYSLESKRNILRVDYALKNQHLSKWTDEMFKPLSSSEDEEKSVPAPKQRKKARQSHFKRVQNSTPLLSQKEKDTDIEHTISHDILSNKKLLIVDMND